MKRSALVRHLREHGCEFAREGRRHEVWQNPVTGESDAVPRHQEIGNIIAKAICKRLGVPPPRG
ncbi:MAG: type II toxin-antitoxin system HicA family toxin [Dehalococcoidia bacterium]